MAARRPVRLLVLSILVTGIFCSTDASAFDVRNDGKLLVLSNGRDIEVTVSPDHGGELCSLRVRHEGEWRELIYRALDYSVQEGWRGKASLLWPATGVSIDKDGVKNSFRLGETAYEMPLHGFARHQKWIVKEKILTADRAGVVLQLRSSDVTKANYPFDFSVQVEYSLSNEKVSLIYTVAASARNDNPMPFSIGNHITFRLPLLEGSSIDATRFRSNLPLLLVTDERRVFTGEILPSPFDGIHALTQLPKRRSVSFGGGRRKSRMSLMDESGFAVELTHEIEEGQDPEAVDFNIWVDLDEGFASPEPWAGAQNSLNSGLGRIQLAPGEHWRWRVDIQTNSPLGK